MLLDKILRSLHATPYFDDISVIENDAVDAETFHFKIRAKAKGGTLQIRLLRDRSFNRYSFQWYSDKPLLRWDNTPHFPELDNTPHHFHDEDNNVFPSTLTGVMLSDIEVVLEEIKRHYG